MPERDGNPRLTSVVPFLYGVADRSWLPGTVLVRLLTDVGASESAARSVLARLRTEGALTSVRRGRETDYQLAGLVRDAFRRVRSSANPDRVEQGAAPTPWAGVFSGLLFAVPEASRAYRDRLRNAARLAGYAALRPGLMIAVCDAWSMLGDVLDDLPVGATAYPITLGMRPDDARRAAQEAWQLDRVARNTATAIRRLEAAATQSPRHAGPAVLRSYVELALPAYRFFVGIPPLPAALVPDDWPLPRLVTALAAVRDGLGAAAEAYVSDVLAGG